MLRPCFWFPTEGAVPGVASDTAHRTSCRTLPLIPWLAGVPIFVIVPLHLIAALKEPKRLVGRCTHSSPPATTHGTGQQELFVRSICTAPNGTHDDSAQWENEHARSTFNSPHTGNANAPTALTIWRRGHREARMFLSPTQAVLERIGHTIVELSEEVTSEPLPERVVALLDHDRAQPNVICALVERLRRPEQFQLIARNGELFLLPMETPE